MRLVLAVPAAYLQQCLSHSAGARRRWSNFHRRRGQRGHPLTDPALTDAEIVAPPQAPQAPKLRERRHLAP
jgi:hypothetical protein